MVDVFIFDEKRMERAGWEPGQGCISGPMYFGEFDGGTHVYIGKAYETINDIDPTNFAFYTKINIITGPVDRRVSYFKYFDKSLSRNALKYIKSQWK